MPRSQKQTKGAPVVPSPIFVTVRLPPAGSTSRPSTMASACRFTSMFRALPRKAPSRYSAKASATRHGIGSGRIRMSACVAFHPAHTTRLTRVPCRAELFWQLSACLSPLLRLRLPPLTYFAGQRKLSAIQLVSPAIARSTQSSWRRRWWRTTRRTRPSTNSHSFPSARRRSWDDLLLADLNQRELGLTSLKPDI